MKLQYGAIFNTMPDPDVRHERPISGRFPFLFHALAWFQAGVFVK